MPTAKNQSIGALMAGAVLMLAACSSQDKHIFYSSPDRPTTLMVYDAIADKALWVKEIPVGQTLELDFDRNGEDESHEISGRPATSLQWRLYLDPDGDPIEDERVELPGSPVLMKVSYRPGPESPALPATVRGVPIAGP